MTERLPTPTERLVLSRERLRVALQSAAAVRTGTGAAGESHGAWLDGLLATPGLGPLVEAAVQWWDRHPLRSVGTALVAVAKSALQPIAQRHPLGLVLAAVLLGAVLVWSRPWQAIFRPSLWAGLLPSILAGAAARSSLQSWLAALATADPRAGRPAAP